MPSNLFQEIMEDADAVQERLLGPTYPYHQNIKNPSELGMSDKGTIRAVGNNIDGLINYVELLVTGNSKASKTGKPLGNKFFLKTGGKCIDKKTDTEQERYIYINNVPSGNIPFISSGLGVNFSEFKGLIPGSMEHLNVLNPFAIMRSFLAGGKPKCQKITMEIIDNKNNTSNESQYVTLADIKSMSPCIFLDNKNPVTKNSCRETFNNNDNTKTTYKEESCLEKVYYTGLSILGIFIIYRIMIKERKR